MTLRPWLAAVAVAVVATGPSRTVHPAPAHSHRHARAPAPSRHDRRIAACFTRFARHPGQPTSMNGIDPSLFDPHARHHRLTPVDRLDRCIGANLDWLQPSRALEVAHCLLTPPSGRRRAHDEACLVLARALASWGDVGGALTAATGIDPPVPGVFVQSVGDPGHVTGYESSLLTALGHRGRALATCRDQHGTGTVRVVLVAARGAPMTAISVSPADIDPGLRACVVDVARRATLDPDDRPGRGERWTVAAEVDLSRPRAPPPPPSPPSPSTPPPAPAP